MAYLKVISLRFFGETEETGRKLQLGCHVIRPSFELVVSLKTALEHSLHNKLLSFMVNSWDAYW
jgi:hypothetical protein